MNLPNKLTVLRVALVPVFVVLLLVKEIPQHVFWALLVFAGASLTDMLDGKIARRRNLITTFGKLMDPLADKILVMSAMICFVELEMAPAFVVIIILAREFLVTSIRLVAAGEGIVIAADNWGKIKTVTQMVWVIYTLLWMWFEANPAWTLGLSLNAALIFYLIMQALMWASVAFTLISGVNYVWQSRNLIFKDM